MLCLDPDAKRKLFRDQAMLDERYLVEEQTFARGKFATVKRCSERSTGKKFAAKFMRKRRSSAEIQHEIAVLQICEACPRIVTLYEVYENPFEMILILELGEGGDLQTTLDEDDNVLIESEVVQIMRQVLEGLLYLHQKNVAHLDVKPQNIVLMGKLPGCDVKLCDFGVSRVIHNDKELRAILGTPDYVAPEILNFEPLSLKTDMWSVGVLAYVLLSGCTPFGGETIQETYCNITETKVDFPKDLFEDISTDARDFITRLLVANQRNRPGVHECLEHSWLASAPSCHETLEEKVDGDSSSSSSNNGCVANNTNVPATPSPGDADPCDTARDLSYDDDGVSDGRADLSARSSSGLDLFFKLSESGSSDRSSGVFSCMLSDFSGGYGSDTATDESSSLFSLEEMLEEQLGYCGLPRRMPATADSCPSRRSVCDRLLDKFLVPSRRGCGGSSSEQPRGGESARKPWERLCAGAVARAQDRLRPGCSRSKSDADLRNCGAIVSHPVASAVEESATSPSPSSSSASSRRWGARGALISASIELLKLRSEQPARPRGPRDGDADPCHVGRRTPRVKLLTTKFSTEKSRPPPAPLFPEAHGASR